MSQNMIIILLGQTTKTLHNITHNNLTNQSNPINLLSNISSRNINQLNPLKVNK